MVLLLFYFVLCAAFFFIIAAITVFISYKLDNLKLKSTVNDQLIKDYNLLNNWIYRNKGFKQNDQYFLFKSLGPTPIHVLNQGGDCSDKSRLLMAILRAYGIDSTLVMLYDAKGEIPTHTVVEIRDGELKAVADPVFDIVFPKPEGGFYGLQDLRENPNLLTERLDILLKAKGETDKIAFYNRTDESYQFATTINWRKNNLTQTIARSLEKLNIRPETVPRPQFLDHPKLLISMSSLLFGAGLSVLSMFLYRLTSI